MEVDSDVQEALLLHDQTRDNVWAWYQAMCVVGANIIPAREIVAGHLDVPVRHGAVIQTIVTTFHMSHAKDTSLQPLARYQRVGKNDQDKCTISYARRAGGMIQFIRSKVSVAEAIVVHAFLFAVNGMTNDVQSGSVSVDSDAYYSD